jgi:protein ImuA
VAKEQGQLLDNLRRHIARLERPGEPSRAPAIPLGVPEIDGALPGGGLARGALHEVAGRGPDVEHGAAAALLTAGVLARVRGPVLWVSEWRDLFAPGLASVGLSPGRVVHVEAGKTVLLAMEEGLRHPGLAGVVVEVSGALGLTASGRLHLAAEASSVTAFALRRSRRFDDPRLSEPTAAATRWRVACLPSPPPVAHAPDTPGLGPPLWRLELVRARGGAAATWIVEACDAQGRLRLAAHMANRPAAQSPEGIRTSP